MASREDADLVVELLHLIAQERMARGGTASPVRFGRKDFIRFLPEAARLARFVSDALGSNATYLHEAPLEVRLLAMFIIDREFDTKENISDLVREFMLRDGGRIKSEDLLLADLRKKLSKDFLPEDRTALTTQDASSAGSKASPASASPEWIELGNHLGFLAAADHLAVVDWLDDYRIDRHEANKIAREIKRLADEIKARGFLDVTIFVAVTEPEPEVSSILFDAGVYDLPVRSEFWTLNKSDRIAEVRSLIRVPDHVDAFLDEAPRRPTPQPPPTDLYTHRNPALSPEQVQRWFASHARPAHRA